MREVPEAGGAFDDRPEACLRHACVLESYGTDVPSAPEPHRRDLIPTAEKDPTGREARRGDIAVLREDHLGGHLGELIAVCFDQVELSGHGVLVQRI